jgi:hypothetical protein
MATINQSPAGQASVTLSGISLNGITATTSPYWQSTKIVQGGSFAVSFSGETPAPPPLAIPTTGQIWPLGFV